MTRHHRPAYVLALTLMVTSISIALLFTLANRVMMFRYQSALFEEQEQAKELALSGLSIVMSQLSVEKKIDDTQKATASPNEELAMQNLLPIANRWQTIILDRDKDGIDATIQIMVTAEAGKIPLNSLYDFEKKSYRKIGNFDGKAIADALSTVLKKIMHDELFSAVFEQAAKERGKPFDDVTELVTIKKLQPLAEPIFLFPDQERPYALTDIFSLQGNGEIQPTLMSPSLAGLFGLKQLPTDMQARQEMLKKINPSMGAQQVWQAVLADIYEKPLATLPKAIAQALAPKFGASSISVISYAKVGRVTQKVSAVIDIVPAERQSPRSFVIKRLYWL